MKKNKSSAALSWVLGVPAGILLLIAAVCCFAATWYVQTYGKLGFDAVLYTLFSDLSGVQSGLIRDFVLKALLPAVLCTVLLAAVLFFRSDRQLVLHLLGRFRLRLYPFSWPVACLLCVALSGGLLLKAAGSVELGDYLYSLNHQTTIFEDRYQDPAQVEITFPEEKRNLIYIYLESMETSYFSREQGGALPVNLIPELYLLAQENVNFSHNDTVGGTADIIGTNWTIAAMVSHTAGIPLKTPAGIGGNDFGESGGFLSGVTSLTDILRENGYYQALMLGSEASFGGREQYFTEHGIDRIYDYCTAVEDKIIPEDYYVWWGMEDRYLYEYARQELTEIARQGQPFAFTMLTVDTHHIGGYPCELCRDTYDEQYENVLACASRQLSAFVEWLRQQSFYENTTVVIVGDHPSMDGGYFARNVDAGYVRHSYNCILNSAVTKGNFRNRGFCSMDLFATTLAAMGCTIPGDRLGLGTNLFADTPTLMEELGEETLEKEMTKYSRYYFDHFYFSETP